MSRLVAVTVRSLCLLLGLAGLAAAQEPPALEPPSLEPPRAGALEAKQPDIRPKPPEPKPAPPARPNAARPAAPRSDVRPMLAIPGVTAPAVRPPSAYRLPITGPAQPATTPFSPSLDALPLPSEFSPGRAPSSSGGFPLDEPPSPPSLDALPPRSGSVTPRRPSNATGMARPGASAGIPPGDMIPLMIEPLDERPTSDRSPSAGRPAAPRSTNSRAPSDGDRSKPDEEPTVPRPAPRRGTGVLGRLFGPPPPPPPRSRDDSRNDSKPRSDAEAEAGLDPDVIARRRIERQIRATLGDKVRSFEVRITGRNVVVVAQPSRFWLRRSVRRSIETLPALQGYRARIEITE